MSRIMNIKFNTLRKPEFRLCTRIVDYNGKKYVEKVAENEMAKQHIFNLKERIEYAQDMVVGVKALCYEDEIKDGLRFPFVEGESLEKRVNTQANSIEEIISDLKKTAGIVINYNDKYKTTFNKTMEFESVFGNITIPEGELASRIVNIDSCLDNYINVDGTLYCIDCEWVFPIVVPIRYIEYRLVRYFYLQNRELFQESIEFDDFMMLYGFTESEKEVYEQMEEGFLKYVHGEEYKYLYITRFEKDEINIDFQENTNEITNILSTADDKERQIKKLECLINQAEYEREKCYDEIEVQKNLVLGYRRELESSRREMNECRNQLQVCQNDLNSVLNSKSWRHTENLRKLGFYLRKSRMTYLPAKFVKITLKQGPVTSARRVKNYFGKKKKNRVYIPDVYAVNGQVSAQNEVSILNVVPSSNVQGTIAIHIHLYYEDLLEEFYSYLEKMPFIYDLYVSCRDGVDVKKIGKRLKSLEKACVVDVRNVGNRGRDIAPLYVVFAEEIAKHDYFLHVHSKKSLYTNTERVEWRRYSLNSLLGSEDLIRRIFTLLQDESNVGLVFPDAAESVPKEAFSWLKNKDIARAFFNELDIPFEDQIFMYPAGSFFWAKTDALRPLFDLRMTIDRFPEEEGQTDGTFAHMLERATYFVAKKCGYKQAVLDYKEGLLRYNFSYKAFRNDLGVDEKIILSRLEGFDLISFDVFDTLISRTVYDPDDVFTIMKQRIKEKYDVTIDFLDIRKKAENDSNLIRGAKTNIHHIYEELEKYLEGVTISSNELKQMEIELEKELCIPRVSMRNLFMDLLEAGKKVILVSDMYLTSDIIGDMLRNCGYDGWDKIYVSNEVGLRKDADNIWDKVFSDYEDFSICHIGDNVRSDWQTVIDRRRNACWIWNSKDLAKLANVSFDVPSVEANLSVRNQFGLFYNMGIFNSPFAIGSNKEIRFDSSYHFGFSVFGPVFYSFIKWLDEVTPDNAILAFLAREGYLLQKLYKEIHKWVDTEEKKNVYLLASRRSVSVASISEVGDVYEILSRGYTGSVKNLFKSRLGLDISVEDKEITYDKLTPELISYFDSILDLQDDDYMNKFQEEKNGYLEYLRNTVDESRWDDMYLVDVGYSGTIQYFMSKLLKRRVKAAYFAIYNESPLPEKRGCKMEKMYGVKDAFIHTVMEKQLFLEAILSAPYGQLISISKSREGVTPLYKDDSFVKNEIVEMQEGIIEYCKRCAMLDSNYNKGLTKEEKSMLEYTFGDLLTAGGVSKEIANAFSVEDDYCSNGTLAFDFSNNSWSVTE